MSGRGCLRIYLGAAPGVGKTFAMLGEARRRSERGTDVVVGLVETHDRPKTLAQIGDLEVLPRRAVEHRGVELAELDVAAVLARRPNVVVVDELAHTNAPGSTHPKRWQDIDDLLEAGIDVLTTVNVQHLESLNDVVEQITGIAQQETVPDAVVRKADQIELVDMAPEALRRRMAHGNVYPPPRVDAALANFFRVGNLTALRELALLWLADRVDEGLEQYRAEHNISQTWETRERIVVAISGGPESETLIRRAGRIAERTPGGELLSLHVISQDGLTGTPSRQVSRWRSLTGDLGGTFHTVVGDDPVETVLAFARAENATQIVIGASRRGRFARLLREGIGAGITRASGAIDVHLVSHSSSAGGRVLPSRVRGLTRRRRLAGALVGLIGMPVLTLALTATPDLSLSSDLILYFLLAIAVALVGGLWPALATAVGGALLANWFFTDPVGTLTIAEAENLLSLVAMLVGAAAVSVVVERAARRSGEAVRARAEAEFLATVATDVVTGAQALPALLDRVREAFGVRAVAVLEQVHDSDRWVLVDSRGEQPPKTPDEADCDVAVDDSLHLAVSGRSLTAADRRMLSAVASQSALALRSDRLAVQAAAADQLAEATRLRTALLAAVSHDLRTPLAAITASAGALGSPDLALSDADVEDLVAGIATSADQLGRLIANLLDLTRLSTGGLNPLIRPVGLEEIVPDALRGLPADARVDIRVADDLPPVLVDPGLVERIVANLVSNALRHGGSEQPVAITASAHSGRVELRVVDRGPGVAAIDRDRIFEPFQRQGDRDATTGVGLGLAVARGFAEAVGGSLTAEDTPGGGLTMVVTMVAVTDTPLAEAEPRPEPATVPAVPGEPRR